MAKVLAIVAGAIVAIAAIAQLVVPSLVEGRVEASLEEPDESGWAEVEVDSFPAVRLLWGGGDRFEARGRHLRVDLADRAEDPLGRLARFDEVDIELEDLTAGPVGVTFFSLVKGERDSDYTLRMEASTTPLAVAESVGGELGGELGRMIAGAATSTLPDGGRDDLRIDVEGPIDRADGGVDAGRVRTSVEGVPAGPFAEAVVQAVLERM